MNLTQAKAAALEALLDGPFTPQPTDARAPAIHVLKSHGVPIVSREVTQRGQVLIEHRMLDTTMTPEAVKAARQKGLAFALRLHRKVSMDSWGSLIKEIACPFEQDEAKQYLAGIVVRARHIGH